MNLRWRVIRFLRAFVATLLHGDLTCLECGRTTVGFSRFCRRHTDEILRDAGERPDWYLRARWR